MAGKIAKFRLTLEGRAKLSNVLKRAQVHAVRTLLEGCKKIVQPIVASKAPNPGKGVTDEGGILSRGQSEKGFLGQADERRFIKMPGQYWLRDAILAEPIVPIWRMGKLIVELGNTAFYNPGPLAKMSIGFSWKFGGKTAGGIRSTDDLEAGAGWRTLLEKWEYGGSYGTPLNIVARDLGKKLEPQRGIFVKGMLKTVPPYGMFTVAAPFIENRLRNFVSSTLKQSIRTEFGGDIG